MHLPGCKKRGPTEVATAKKRLPALSEVSDVYTFIKIIKIYVYYILMG
jgi:hypothetical protein